MDTVDDVIKAFGGPSRLARELGLKRPQRVTDWRRVEVIPSRHWRDLVDTAQRLGVALTLDQLADMHARRGVE